MRSEIKEILFVQEQFAEGMKRNDFSIIKPYLCEDISITCSTTGQGYGYEEARTLLCYPGPDPDFIKQNVENVITRFEGRCAQQSFHMLMRYTLNGANGQFYFMQYGGTFVLSYIKMDDGWKISRILFELCWIDGNSFWVKDWNLIDYGNPAGYKQLIDTRTDAVNHVIPVCDYQRTDEEQIEEILFQYGWVIDKEDYALFRNIALTGVIIEDGYHNKRFEGMQAWIDFLKVLNAKEPCLHHTYRIRGIQINEEYAQAEMSRLEPNRIGTRAIGGHNYFMDWFTLDYTISLKKVSGCWKLDRVSFVKQIYGIPVC